MSFFRVILLVCSGLLWTAVDAEMAQPTPSAEARAHEFMRQQPPDWAGAHQAFLTAAEAGSPTAMSYLGWIYEQGHGVPADGERAAHWYAQAARAGALDYALKLGWMYLGGKGVAADRQQSEYWFEYAIAANYTPARIALASVLLADALGGKATARVFEARDLLTTALEQDNPLAAFFLARLYLEGIGDQPRDDQRGAHYAKISAEHGNAQMQGWLAVLYFSGRGVKKDLITAAMWAELAAANGDRFGEQVRRALQSRLTPEQLETAQHRAQAWTAAH